MGLTPSLKVWINIVLLLTTGVAVFGVAFVVRPMPVVHACNNCGYLLGWGTVGVPYGVAVDSSGNVYVVEQGYPYNRVDEWTGAGSHIGNPLFTFSGTPVPMGIAVDSSGNVYIVDNQGSWVAKFSNSGSVLKKWGSSGGGAGEFADPTGKVLEDL